MLPSLNEDFTYLLTYLGIFITNNLSWNEHCDKNCKKEISTLGLLRRILSGCAPQVKNTTYCMLVRPKLEYGRAVWNPHTKCNVDKIEMVQRHAARFVCHDYSRYSHVSTLINALGWESLEQRRLNNQVCMFYKIYSGVVGITLRAEINPLTRVFKVL